MKLILSYSEVYKKNLHNHTYTSLIFKFFRKVEDLQFQLEEEALKDEGEVNKFNFKILDT